MLNILEDLKINSFHKIAGDASLGIFIESNIKTKIVFLFIVKKIKKII